MKVVIQRVNHAAVAVDGKTIGKIGKGLLVFLGVGNEDTKEICDRFVDKISKMRIFEDENGKTNLAINDVNGEILVISQFTLYADCKKGNRPSFVNAGKPDLANDLYEYCVEQFKKVISVVETGEFGADMKVSLENDGPFTIILDDSMIK
ncbi:D-aminoacyl-tRNA deacylase [Anaerosporobacter sp.]